jgi:hypothetical protein
MRIAAAKPILPEGTVCGFLPILLAKKAKPNPDV